MIKKVAVFAAVVAVTGLCQPASAGETQMNPDPRLDAVSIGVGAASAVGYLALGGWSLKYHNVNGVTAAGAWAFTTIGCAAVAPMVATLVVDRPLTMREGDSLIASCVIPFIGGWLVDQAFDAHPEWDPSYKPPRRIRHARRR